MAGVQLRRYRLPIEVAEQERWLAWWRDVVELRTAFGFRVVTAVVEPESATFTWIVAHDGDFLAAEQQMMTSTMRADVFARPRPEITILETAFVDQLA